MILDPAVWESRSIAGGAEHDIWEEEGEIWKVTRPDHFGWTVLPGDDGEPFGAYATPLEYLERWSAANHYLGDEVRLRGVSVTERGVQVVVSQPFIAGSHPSMDEIVEDLEARGFFRVKGLTLGAEPESSFYQPGERIAIFDAAPDNFIVSGCIPVPVDVVVIKASEALHQQISRLGAVAPRRPRTSAG